MKPIPEEIQRELNVNEQTQWWGQPRQGITLRGSDLVAIPFSLLWCGFAIFWEYSVVSSGNAPGFFVLWGIPFVCMGLYMVFGRFVADAKQRSNTYYAITNERVLIVSGLFSRKVKSLNIQTLSDLSLSESSNGEGSITFGPQLPFAAFYGAMQGWPGAGKSTGPRFDLIESARQVYDIIRKAQRNASLSE